MIDEKLNSDDYILYSDEDYYGYTVYVYEVIYWVNKIKDETKRKQISKWIIQNIEGE